MPTQTNTRTRGTDVHRQAAAASEPQATYDYRLEQTGPEPTATAYTDEDGRVLAKARAEIAANIRYIDGDDSQPEPQDSARHTADKFRYEERRKTDRAVRDRRTAARASARLHVKPPAVPAPGVYQPVPAATDAVGSVQARRGSSRRRRDRAAPPPRPQPSGSDDDPEPGRCETSSWPFGLTGRGIRRRWHLWRLRRAPGAAWLGSGAAR